MSAMTRRELLGVAALSTGSDGAAQHGGAHGEAAAKPVIPGFVRESFEAQGDERDVYVQGDGPPVLLLHELPGMSWPTILLAQRLADRGFRLYVPRLFGGVGQFNGFAGYLQSCFGRQWDCSAPDGTSRILGWIHALTADIGRRNEGQRMAAIGMCLTGAFPLALMDLRQVVAAVLSQPALPLKQGKQAERAGLGLSAAEIDRAVQRQDARFLALRFSADDLCRKERFDTLDRLLSSRLETMVIPSGPGTQFPKDAHAVLTGWYHSAPDNPTREAYDKVIAFLAQTLK